MSRLAPVVALTVLAALSSAASAQDQGAPSCRTVAEEMRPKVLGQQSQAAAQTILHTARREGLELKLVFPWGDRTLTRRADRLAVEVAQDGRIVSVGCS